LLDCVRNELAVTRVRVRVERIERRREFQVGEVVGVVCMSYYLRYWPQKGIVELVLGAASQSFS